MNIPSRTVVGIDILQKYRIYLCYKRLREVF